MKQVARAAQDPVFPWDHLFLSGKERFGYWAVHLLFTGEKWLYYLSITYHSCLMFCKKKRKQKQTLQFSNFRFWINEHEIMRRILMKGLSRRIHTIKDPKTCEKTSKSIWLFHCHPSVKIRNTVPLFGNFPMFTFTEAVLLQNEKIVHWEFMSKKLFHTF